MADGEANWLARFCWLAKFCWPGSVWIELRMGPPMKEAAKMIEYDFERSLLFGWHQL